MSAGITGIVATVALNTNFGDGIPQLYDERRRRRRYRQSEPSTSCRALFSERGTA